MKTPAPRAERKRKYSVKRNDGLPRGMWHPELVGRSGYPKTEEAFQRRVENGKRLAERFKSEGRPMNRKGVTDGWGGKKAKIAEIRAQATKDATAVINYMISNGMINMVPEDDEGKAKASLEATARIALDETQPLRERLAANRLLLEFTKSKPAQKSEVKLEKPEDWLTVIARSAMKTEGDT